MTCRGRRIWIPDSGRGEFPLHCIIRGGDGEEGRLDSVCSDSPRGTRGDGDGDGSRSLGAASLGGFERVWLKDGVGARGDDFLVPLAHHRVTISRRGSVSGRFIITAVRRCGPVGRVPCGGQGGLSLGSGQKGSESRWARRPLPRQRRPIFRCDVRDMRGHVSLRKRLCDDDLLGLSLSILWRRECCKQ